METNPVHVQPVLEKMDTGIPTAASGAPKMEQDQAQFCSRRHCAYRGWLSTSQLLDYGESCQDCSRSKRTCSTSQDQDQDKLSGQACHQNVSASGSWGHLMDYLFDMTWLNMTCDTDHRLSRLRKFWNLWPSDTCVHMKNLLVQGHWKWTLISAKKRKKI